MHRRGTQRTLNLPDENPDIDPVGVAPEPSETPATEGV